MCMDIIYEYNVNQKIGQSILIQNFIVYLLYVEKVRDNYLSFKIISDILESVFLYKDTGTTQLIDTFLWYNNR